MFISKLYSISFSVESIWIQVERRILPRRSARNAAISHLKELTGAKNKSNNKNDHINSKHSSNPGSKKMKENESCFKVNIDSQPKVSNLNSFLGFRIIFITILNYKWFISSFLLHFHLIYLVIWIKFIDMLA